MLISTNENFELLQGVLTLLFCERGIRGGINGVGEFWHFIAKNPHLNSFDPNEKTAFGVFSDLKSLFSGRIQEMMPLGNHQWISVITLDQILGTPEYSNDG